MAAGPIAFWSQQNVTEWICNSYNHGLSAATKQKLQECIKSGPEVLLISNKVVANLGVTSEEAEILLRNVENLRQQDEDAGALLALRLFLEDLDSQGTQSSPDAPAPDTSALAAQKAETEAAMQKLSDALLAQRMHQDMLLTAELDAKYAAILQQEETDFAMAQRLSGVTRVRGSSVTRDVGESSALRRSSEHLSIGKNTSSDGQRMQKWKTNSAASTSAPPSAARTSASPSAASPSTPSAPATTQPPLLKCNSCMESSSGGMFPLKCGHTFCKACFGRLFQMAALDEELLPVRCCKKPVDQSLADVLLSPMEAQRFKDKLQEHLAVNRMYCTNPRCSKFYDLDVLPPELLIRGARFRCIECSKELCARCKTAWHEGLFCSEFQGLPDHRKVAEDEAAALRLAGKNAWQACTRCKQMVSLDSGCNHMTCRCSHEFCYVCSKTWKTCQCPTWFEPNLYEAAAREVQEDVEALGQQFNAQEQREAIRHRAEVIRVNHDCAHGSWLRCEWEFKRKPPRCLHCERRLNLYGYKCRSRCNRYACGRCAFHRLR